VKTRFIVLDWKENHPMYKSHCSALLAAILVALSATQTVGQAACKPVLAFQQVRFSEIRSWQRVWTAFLDVDASRCATTSGRFAINFIRLTEVGPDLPFTEQFTWSPGRTEVSVDFSADEAVLDYSIGYTAPCPCRD
jgi:hypothetical protein